MGRREKTKMAGGEGDEADNTSIPKYDPSSCFYSMKLWHAGQVVKRDGVLEYWEGDFVIVDYCDYDRMSIVELDSIVKEKLGYNVGAVYYLKVPGQNDLQYVETDNYLMRCLDQCLLFSRLVEVFCSHPIFPPVIPEVPLRVPHQQLEWHGPEDVDVDNSEDSPAEDRSDACEVGEGVEDVDPDMVDSDYAQSEDDERMNAEAEENLDGLLRGRKGKGIAVDLEEGVECMDSDSDSDCEFGTKTHHKDSTSSGEEDGEEEHVGAAESGSVRRRKKLKKKMPKLPEFNPATDKNNPTFELGLLFPNGESFKEAIKSYAIVSGKDIYFRRNEPRRVRALCSKKKSCPWVCYATKMRDTDDFMIKTYNPEHKCGRTVRNRFATSEWLATKYADTLKTNSSWSAGDFVTQIKRDHVLEVSRQKAYRAKKRAETLVEGTIRDQFAVLWDYAAEIKMTNPGSTVLLKTELDAAGQCLFKRIYIAYEACKTGFIKGCRKLVSLDGCHLKGPLKGQLLTAIGIDANNSLYPIAFAVVEAECKDSWTWFLDILREDININNCHHWTFISDKQKGLEQSLKEMWGSEEEQGEHRHCARHVQQNFTKVFKGQQLKNNMMCAAMSCTVSKFKAHMEEIKLLNPKAFDWLMEKGPYHWCKAYFRTNVKCDILLNNLCETFNGTNSILNAREKPILSLLERIRMYILQRFAKQKLAGTKWFLSVGPRICKILEKSKKDAAGNIAYWCGAQTYQVIDSKGTPFSIDLTTSTCSCRKWDLSGIPCSHAIACIWHKQQDPEDFVCDWYKKDAYDRAYAGIINPIRAQSEWPVTDNLVLHPPAYRKQPGRPKKSRRYEHDEVFPSGSTKMRRVYNIGHCKLCGREGHNSRTCPSRPTSNARASQARLQRTSRNRATSASGDRVTQPASTIINDMSSQLSQVSQPPRVSPRIKMTARKQVSPKFKTTARKRVNASSGRRLYEKNTTVNLSTHGQASQMTEES